DKDNSPHWHWPDVASIPRSVVEAHFVPTWEGEHPLRDL
ncbi:MAG: enoyl-CoA hydratase/isomerase family protein, partial [Pseudomonas sp.]